MRKLLTAGIAFAVLTISSSLQAYACDPCYCGFYGQVFGGVNWMPDSDLDYRPVGAGTSHLDEFEHDVGWIIGGAAGHSWPSGWSGEFEISYRDNDFDRYKNSTAAYDARGDVNIWAFMLNGYYRHFNDCWCVVPYVGAGVGLARVSVTNRHPSFGLIDDDDVVFAYQAILGASYCICDCWDLFAEYRYLGTSDPEYRTTTHLIESEIDSHVIAMGIRFAIE